jgi:hypothetical protein
MMEAVKSAKAVGANLKTLFETQQLFVAFGDNVKRVADDLAASNVEVQKLVNSALISKLIVRGVQQLG